MMAADVYWEINVIIHFRNELPTYHFTVIIEHSWQGSWNQSAQDNTQQALMSHNAIFT